ncbi:MAG: DUF4276 family protein [Treponema sp.]|nr:DUF4276 family protein [Candidatus Treponema merdequi]
MSIENIVFFLEELSAKEMLKIIVPKIIPHSIEPFYFSFEGKQDLEKNIKIKIQGWRRPNTVFLVMRDKDSENCFEVKKRLVQDCLAAGKTQNQFLIRIACTELENFYLGDIEAIKKAGYRLILSQHHKNRYNDPDNLAGAYEMNKITNSEYQKVQGSKKIAPYLDLSGKNKSVSFNMLINGIKKLCCC